jgi:hypothetical protein
MSADAQKNAHRRRVAAFLPKYGIAPKEYQERNMGLADRR